MWWELGCFLGGILVGYLTRDFFVSYYSKKARAKLVEKQYINEMQLNLAKLQSKVSKLMDDVGGDK